MSYKKILKNNRLYSSYSDSEINEAVDRDIELSLKYFGNKTFLEIYKVFEEMRMKGIIKTDIINSVKNFSYDDLFLKKCLELKRGGYYEESHKALTYYAIKNKLLRGDYGNTWFKVIISRGYIGTAFRLVYVLGNEYYNVYEDFNSQHMVNLEGLIFLVNYSLLSRDMTLLKKQIKLWSGNPNHKDIFTFSDLKLFKRNMDSIIGFDCEYYSFNIKNHKEWLEYYSS